MLAIEHLTDPDPSVKLELQYAASFSIAAQRGDTT
jgi:hypothetical protein